HPALPGDTYCRRERSVEGACLGGLPPHNTQARMDDVLLRPTRQPACLASRIGVRIGKHALHLFFNDTATTEIYTLSLHDALPIWADLQPEFDEDDAVARELFFEVVDFLRSEEHTSELQSHLNLVCRLLLEKK